MNITTPQPETLTHPLGNLARGEAFSFPANEGPDDVEPHVLYIRGDTRMTQQVEATSLVDGHHTTFHVSMQVIWKDAEVVVKG